MHRETSGLSEIIRYPDDPLKFFKRIRLHYLPKELTMNLATVDSEFGVLNRTVVCRGWCDDEVVYVTQKYTRNYKNLKDNPKACVTFFFPQLVFPEQSENQCFTNWQVRLLGAEAVEITDEEHLDDLWDREPLFAKIRAYICNCGQPVEHNMLKESYDEFQKKNYDEVKGWDLQRPDTYTAYKLKANIWDFYKSAGNKIADRVQYHRLEEGKWKTMHVAT